MPLERRKEPLKQVKEDAMARNRDSAPLLIRPARPDDYREIRDFLLESSSLYPGIELWWDHRILPTLEQQQRVVLVVDAGRSLEGLFIGKFGGSAKLCTLRLRESIRNQGIGRALVTEGLSRLLQPDTAKFHVTVSEAAEEGSTAFFESIGFRRIAVEPARYRAGVDEFIYSCPRAEIVEAIRNARDGLDQNLYGACPVRMPDEQTILMSLKPEFATAILSGRKSIEFRRRFSKAYEGATVVFYIARPVQQFVFSAKIARVDRKPKTGLWALYHDKGGIAKTVFDDYFSGTEHGYAIHLSLVKRLPNTVALEHAQSVCPSLRPPQSFQRLEPESPLFRALDLPVHI